MQYRYYCIYIYLLAFHFRYCLFGLNVGLTEKFESNSQPMKIHVSEPCKQLLSAQYKCEQRDAPEVREKCGGHMSYFLTTKDGRQPLRPEVIKALLPTAAEMPSVGVKKEEKKADAPKKEEKKADAPKKEEKKEEEKKEEAPKKADAPAPKPAEAKKADAPAPKPTAAPAAAKDPAPTAASPTAASGPSAPVEEDPASQETSAPTESAPEEVNIKYSIYIITKQMIKVKHYFFQTSRIPLHQLLKMKIMLMNLLMGVVLKDWRVDHCQ